MQNKLNNLTQAKYWDLLLAEVLNQGLPTATFYFIPYKERALKQSNCSNNSQESNKIIQTNALSNKKQQINRSRRYFLGPPFENVYLTPREIEIIKQLLQGKTLNKTADVLDLSPRTVEFYLDNVKKKICCRKKNQLISLFKENDLLASLSNSN